MNEFLNEFETEPPSLSLLSQVIAKIAASFPYENLSVFYKSNKPTLNKTLLLNKLFSNQGGVCLELNQFLTLVLLHFKFSVYPKSAKVIRGLDESSPRANRKDSHSVLLVSWKNNSPTYLCDVGFSEDIPSSPIPLSNGEFAVGFGGKECMVVEGSWLGKDGWFLDVWDKSKVEVRMFSNYYFFETDAVWGDEYWENMLNEVSTPETSPPFPYGVEYATIPSINGGRHFIVGKKNFWKYFLRDMNGKYVEKFDINDPVKFRNILLEIFKIDLEAKESQGTYSKK